MHRPAALLAAGAVLGILGAAPAAGQIAPGAQVDALIGLNWDDPAPMVRTGSGMQSTVRPLVTATVTTELSVADLGHRSSASNGRMAFRGRPVAHRFLVTLAGGHPSTLQTAVPVLMQQFLGGGITGRPAALALRQPGPLPSGRPDDLNLLISLTTGP